MTPTPSPSWTLKRGDLVQSLFPARTGWEGVVVAAAGRFLRVRWNDGECRPAGVALEFPSTVRPAQIEPQTPENA